MDDSCKISRLQAIHETCINNKNIASTRWVPSPVIDGVITPVTGLICGYMVFSTLPGKSKKT